MLASLAHAVTIYDEAIDGDFNGIVGGPTFLSPGTDIGALQSGINSIFGSFGQGVGPRDDDVFTFTVPVGYVLSGMELTQFLPSSSVGGGSYVAINDDAFVGTGLSTAAGNLSDALVSTSGDLFAEFLSGPYSFGSRITQPLAAGVYSMFWSEISTSVDYQLDLELTAVPVPASVFLLITAVISLIRYSRLADK